MYLHFDCSRILLQHQATEVRPLAEGPRTLVTTQHTVIKPLPKPSESHVSSASSSSSVVYTGSPNVKSRSPSSRTIKSPAKYQGWFVDLVPLLGEHLHFLYVRDVSVRPDK